MTTSSSSSTGTTTPTTVTTTAGRELLLELKRCSSSLANSNSNNNNDIDNYQLPSYNTKLVRLCLEELLYSVETLTETIQAQQLKQQQQLQQTNDENDDDDDAHEISMTERPSMLLHHASIQRQKRYLLAYHKHRLDKLKQRYLLFPTIPITTTTKYSSSSHSHNNNNNNNNINKQQHHYSPYEIEFMEQYQDLRSNYIQMELNNSSNDIDDNDNNDNNDDDISFIDSLGLLPPSSLSHMCQVRVVQPYNTNTTTSSSHDNDNDNDNDNVIVLSNGRTMDLSTIGSLHYVPRSDIQDLLLSGIVELVDGEEMG